MKQIEKKKALPEGITIKDNIALFDGVCNVCNKSVQFLISREPDCKIKIASLQSETGKKVLTWYGLSLKEFDTIIFLEKGQIYYRSTAFFKIIRYLNFPWPFLYIGILIPTLLRDWLYDRIAQNRYRWFGKRESCMLPSSQNKERFLP